MTITLTVRTDGAALMSTVPNPDRIPVPAVREAVATLAKRADKLREATAALSVASDAKAKAEREAEVAAARAAESGGEVPTKKLARQIRDAAEALEEARLEVSGRQAAAMKAISELATVVEHHSPAWRDAAVRSADAAILKLTTARRMAQEAGADLAEHIGVLTMLDLIPQTRRVVLQDGGMAEVHASAALDELGSAIGAAMQRLDAERAAAKRRAEVVVEAPSEDDPADPSDELAEFEIEADSDEVDR